MKFNVPKAAKSIKSTPTSTKKARSRPILAETPGEHVSVNAGAGCGKTTTVEWAYRSRVLGQKIPFTPSVAQEAIMDCFVGTPPTASVQFVCFNKSIATEFNNRNLPGCTNHSLGFSAVRRFLPRVNVKAEYRIKDICEDLGFDPKKDWDTIRLLEKVTSLSRMNLVGWREDQDPKDPGSLFPEDLCHSDLDSLVAHYGLDLNGKERTVYSTLPQILRRCASDLSKINFDDMIWLPVVRGLPLDQFDLLFVDERQDLNLCQLALLKRACERMAGIGDVNQAIYGFSGASAEAFGLMDSWMESSERGIRSLRLMETRRCPKAVVALAQSIVPDFQALPEAPEGRITRGITWDTMLGLGSSSDPSSEFACRPGDMILCRVNAPLVQMVYRFIREGKRANIQGRDIGQGILSLVRKSKASSIQELIVWAEDARGEEERKVLSSKYPSDSKLQAINDKYDCVNHLAMSCQSIQDLENRINVIFQDNADRSSTILLSSVHRAKGLEAERVYILCPEKMPLVMKNPQPWELDQERNLQYVAWTRSKSDLIFTVTPKGT